MRNHTKTLLFVFCCYFIPAFPSAQILDKSWQSLVLTSDSAWFGTQEAIRVAENVMLYQRDIGGWPKNIAMQQPLSEEEKRDLLKLKKDPMNATIDNGATMLEMLFLSKIHREVPDEKYKESFLKGLDYLLEAQYENGGWPQFYPLRDGYYSHITYNDDAMVSVLRLFKNLLENPSHYSIVPPLDTMNKVRVAFDKGIVCILKTQYVSDGVLTSWCAQHDTATLEPAKARAYELPSLSGKESVEIVDLLMSIDQPTPDIQQAIKSAVAWFKRVQISGLRQERSYNEKGKPNYKKMVKDQDAPVLWARFYDLETMEPFFCDRDGIKRSTLSDISRERRLGYRWYTQDPQKVIDAFPVWLERISE